MCVCVCVCVYIFKISIASTSSALRNASTRPRDCTEILIYDSLSSLGFVLAFTRYLFSSRPLYENQYYYSQTPPLFGHPTPPLHPPHYCTKQCSPPTILYCNACHTILVVAISCKGQGSLRAVTWPSQDIANTSFVWCMAYIRRFKGALRA